MENQNRKSSALDAATAAVGQEFSNYKHQLQRMLQYIEETARRFEFHEVVKDIKFYLELIADQPGIRAFGLDLIRSFISRIHDMDRLVTIPRHWVSRNGTPVFEVNSANSRDFSPEKEKRFDNWKKTTDTANQPDVVWHSSTFTSETRSERYSLGRGNGSRSRDFDLSRYVERREPTPGPSRQNKEPMRIPDWLRETGESTAPPSPAPARRSRAPSSTFVPGQDELNDGMNDFTQNLVRGTPFEDPLNRHRESVSQQQIQSSLFLGGTPQPRDSRSNHSGQGAQNQYQIPPQPHLSTQPQVNSFAPIYFPEMFQIQPSYPMVAQPSQNQHFFPGQAQAIPNQPYFPPQAQMNQNPPHLPPQPQHFGGPWPVPPRPQPVQVPTFNLLPIILPVPLPASCRPNNSARFPHRRSRIRRHAQFSRPKYTATPSSSVSIPTNNPSVSPTPPPPGVSEETSRLASPTPTPSPSNCEGVERLEKEKVGGNKKKNDNPQAEIGDDGLVENEHESQLENELQHESISISNCERSGRNEKEQVNEKSQTIDQSAEINDASIHVVTDTQATVTPENQIQNDTSANPSENHLQNDTRENLTENDFQIGTSANQEEIVPAAAAIENETENNVATDINAASGIQNEIEDNQVENPTSENDVGIEINVTSEIQNQFQDNEVENPPGNHVGIEINITNAIANMSEHSVVTNHPENHIDFELNQPEVETTEQQTTQNEGANIDSEITLENPSVSSTSSYVVNELPSSSGAMPLNSTPSRQQRKRQAKRKVGTSENVPKYSFRKTKQRLEKEFKVATEKASASKPKKKKGDKPSLLHEESLKNAERREEIRKRGMELFVPQTSGVITGLNDLVIKPNLAKVKVEPYFNLSQVKQEKEGVTFVNIDTSEVVVVSADDGEVLQVDQDDQDAFEDGNESNQEMDIETKQENEDPDQTFVAEDTNIQDSVVEEDEDGGESEIAISDVISLQADKGNNP